MSTIPFLKTPYMNELESQVKAGRVVAYSTAEGVDLDMHRMLTNTHLKSNGDPPHLTVGEAKNKQERAATDYDNARALHSFLPAMTPLEASDRRLWAYLSHGPFHQYCLERWPIEDGDESNKTVNHIRSHWFFYRGGLRRNAISRLWWAAEFTHAPWKLDRQLERFQKDDEYHYTKVLLSNQDVYQGIIERDFGSSPAVRTCALDVFATHDDGGVQSTSLATEFTMGVNLLATHTELVGLDVEELHGRLTSLCSNVYQRLKTD